MHVPFHEIRDELLLIGNQIKAVGSLSNGGRSVPSRWTVALSKSRLKDRYQQAESRSLPTPPGRLCGNAVLCLVRHDRYIQNQVACMALRSSPEAPGGTMQWSHIRKAIPRLVVCIGAVFAVTAALYAVPLDRRPLTSALSFLFVVLIVSATWGFRYSLFVSFLAALGFSWLLPPVGRFWLSDPRDVFVLAALLVIGITTSRLSDRARREALTAKQRLLEVTEAQQARQEIEEQWRAAFENNPTMYFIIDEAGAIASVNAFGAEQLGYTVSELVGQPVLSVFYEPDRQAVQGHAKDCFEQPGRMMRWEARKIRKDGTMLWVRETGNAIVLKNRPVLLVVCEDITEQKRAEAAARRSENQLRDVIETMPAHVWSTLPDGALDFVNQRWQEFTGLPLEDALGWNWETVVHPDDKSRFVAEWRAALKNQQPMESEIRVRRKDGEYRWLFVRNVPLRNELGNIVKWYGTGIEIDDRKRAEALLSGEKRILEMMAKGDSLAQILDSLCRLVEEQTTGVLTSILLLDGDRLRHGGAPSLPKAYTDAIDGVVIGPAVGSCGTAAYRGEQVIVEDIATDPLWADYREAALPHSLRACWSTPVFSTQGKVMATFAMYYREPRSPSPRDQEIIEQITHLAGVVIARKLTLEALQRSQAYLADAQRLNRTGSWAYNPFTGKTIYWSEEMFRIFGLGPQEVPSSEKFWQLVHPEDLDRVRARVEGEAREKKEYADEYRIVLHDGTLKHILDIGHPVFNGAGEVVEFVGTTVDVTQRKRAEEELRRSEAYLAEAQRLTHTGSWAWEMKTLKVLYCSDEMYRIFGFDPQGGVPTAEDFEQRMHPEDHDNVHAIAWKAITQKADYVVEHRIVRPDGTVKYILTTGHPVLNGTGEVVEYFGTSADVTERRRAEEALRRSEAYLAEAQKLTHTGSCAWNMVTREVNHSSAEHSRLYGFDPELGIPSLEAIFQRVHPEDRAAAIATLERAFRERTDSENDFRAALPDGTIKYIHAVGHPFFDAAGNLVEYVGTAVDVTERKRAEEERERLRQLEADLAHIGRVSMMGELAASLAHELNQPITAAITNANTSLRWLARAEPDLDEAREAIMRIVKDGTRAAEVINRLRSFYKKGTPPQPELVDVNEVAHEMMMLLRNEANRYSIAIRTELAPKLPRVMADRVQLQQVFMNLMLNGIEAMKETAGELMVKSERAADGRVLISVSDTGVGLPADKADQIFNAFFTTKPQGTGMGLAITRSIIEAHGGRLWASANTGRGATFHCTLPREATASSTSAG